MLIYIINMILILIYAFLYNIAINRYHLETNLKKIKKFFIILVTTQLILILALRHPTVGVDITNYVNFFQNIIPNLSWQQFMEHRFELGYKVFNKILSLIAINEQILIITIAILCIVPVGWFIYKHSKMPFLSFVLYLAFNFYAFTFSGLRQGIAYGLILLSYDFIVKRKLIKFLLCVLLASLFHQSALIFLPAYFLSYIKLNKKTLSLIIIICTVLFLLRQQIFVFVTQNIFTSYEIVESASINWMMLGLLITVLGLFFYKRVITISPKSSPIFIFMIIGVTLMTFSTVGTNVMRMADYYYVFIILFIPEILNSIKEKSILILGGYIIIIFIFVLNLWFLMYSDTYGIVPYKFFWE